jgi:hypothetical protein
MTVRVTEYATPCRLRCTSLQLCLAKALLGNGEAVALWPLPLLADRQALLYYCDA